MENEYHIIKNIVRDDEWSYPSGQILYRGSREETFKVCKERNYKSYDIVKATLKNGHFSEVEKDKGC